MGGVAQWREWAAEGASTREGDISSTNSEEDKPVLNRMRQTKVYFIIVMRVLIFIIPKVIVFKSRFQI